MVLANNFSASGRLLHHPQRAVHRLRVRARFNASARACDPFPRACPREEGHRGKWANARARIPLHTFAIKLAL